MDAKSKTTWNCYFIKKVSFSISISLHNKAEELEEFELENLEELTSKKASISEEASRAGKVSKPKVSLFRNLKTSKSNNNHKLKNNAKSDKSENSKKTTALEGSGSEGSGSEGSSFGEVKVKPTSKSNINIKFIMRFPFLRGMGVNFSWP